VRVIRADLIDNLFGSLLDVEPIETMSTAYRDWTQAKEYWLQYASRGTGNQNLPPVLTEFIYSEGSKSQQFGEADMT
jgi:hypothetical protein